MRHTTSLQPRWRDDITISISAEYLEFICSRKQKELCGTLEPAGVFVWTVQATCPRHVISRQCTQRVLTRQSGAAPSRLDRPTEPGI